jgi:hypothetical protein
VDKSTPIDVIVLKRRISLKKDKAIYIGETIKQLRKEFGISQEEQ